MDKSGEAIFLPEVNVRHCNLKKAMLKVWSQGNSHNEIDDAYVELVTKEKVAPCREHEDCVLIQETK